MQMPRETPEFVEWRRSTQVAIRYTFGENSQHIKDFNRIHYIPFILSEGTSEHTFHKAYADGLRRASAVLRSMIDEIEEYWDDDVQPSASDTHAGAEQSAVGTRVFVAHGRDDGVKQMVARFIGNLGLDPVILQEQPNEGRTIIEKLEESAQSVAYAIILCTPDDLGGLVTDADAGALQPRMRQNVVFELGFFTGAIGRSRVCLLAKGDFEMLSNYAGVTYTKWDDAGGWQIKLAQDLRKAGLPVDLNRIL